MKKYNKYFFRVMIIIFIFFSFNIYGKDIKAGNNDYINKKQYTIYPKNGDYSENVTVRIKAKKGYRIYYTTGSDFSSKKFVKSGKTKKIKISKDTLLRVYYQKKNISLTDKELKDDLVLSRAQKYNYRIIKDKGNDDEDDLSENGSYTSKEDVALYLYTYKKLPPNFITKNEAKKLGWSGGGLDDYKYGFCIGGDYFSNFEGNLPEGEYHECDIDTLHKKSRGVKRLVYSDTGKIYYTEDHYDTFTLLYDGWK